MALDWICGNPQRWKRFVANRVTCIQELIAPSNWRYCKSDENPSDCGSRGVMPIELLENCLYWEGPPWLRLLEDEWPSPHRPYMKEDTALEMKKDVLLISSNLVKNESSFDMF